MSVQAAHARDISDGDFCRAVDMIERRQGYWVNRFAVGEALGNPPAKVVLAKARRLMARGLLDGCDCGCRGDFTIISLRDVTP